METRTTKRRKSGIRSKRKSNNKPSYEGFFNHKYTATERQLYSKIVKEETPVPRNHWVGDPWYYLDEMFFEDCDILDHYDVMQRTVGGKFLKLLERLDIVDRGYPFSNNWNIYDLYSMMVKTPAGIVYADVYEKTKFDKILKKDGKVLSD